MSNGANKTPENIILLNQGTTGDSGSYTGAYGIKHFQGTVTGTGAVTATIDVEVSTDDTNWVVMGSIVLSGTDSATDAFASDTNWPYVRGNLTAISGTGAEATLTMGV
jgi:hypothetical protein